MTYDRLTDDGFTALMHATYLEPRPCCPACRAPFHTADANALRDHAATCEPLRVQMFTRAFHIDHDPTACIRLGCGQPVAGRRFNPDGTPDRAGSSICYCQTHARELFAHAAQTGRITETLAETLARDITQGAAPAILTNQTIREAIDQDITDRIGTHDDHARRDAADDQDDDEPRPPDPPHWTTDAFGEDLKAERSLTREREGE